MGKDLRPLSAIIFVNFIWGLDFIAIEYMMDYVSPAVFTLARLAIGAAVLLVLCRIRNGRFRVLKEDRLHIFIAGAVGMALYFTVENLGTGLTSASFSSLVMATVPVFGMIGDRLVFGNRITISKVVCIAASILGVYLLVSGEPMGISRGGFFAMIAAAVLWAFFIIYTKPLFERYDLTTLLTGLFVSGLIMEIPLAAVSQAVTHAPVIITPFGAMITVLTALVCIVGGEYLYVYAIGGLSPTVTSAFENVLPVTAVIFSFFIFGKTLAGIQMLGGIIIMASVTAIALLEARGERNKAGEKDLK